MVFNTDPVELIICNVTNVFNWSCPTASSPIFASVTASLAIITLEIVPVSPVVIIVPVTFGIVIVLSTVGFVTVNVVSKSSLLEPSNTIVPAVVKFKTETLNT